MSEVTVVKEENVVRYCSQCYTTLCKSEKNCPNECAESEIREFDFSLGGIIIPSTGLCREHPFSIAQTSDLSTDFKGVHDE